MRITKKAAVIRKFTPILLTLTIAFISCKKEVEPLEIVRQSAKAHGGLEEWEKIKTLSFTKKTVLYSEDGTEKKQILQDQFFRFQDGQIFTSINSRLDSVSYKLVRGNIYARKNNMISKLEGEELEKVENLFASAFYVTSQPFHLLQSEAQFEKLQDTLIDNNKAFAIGIRYKEDREDSDKWTYYFDKESYKVVACKVQHNNGRTSVIENTSYDSSTTFLFNATRTSTIVSGAKKPFVIAKYDYSNYKVSLH